MSGKPRGSVGKPKQDPDWRAESTEGHLLPQSRVAVAVCGHGLKTEPFTNCYSKTKTEKTGTKTALTIFVSLLTRAWFMPNSEVFQGIRIAWACQFRSCSYLMLFACEDSSIVHTMLAVAFVHGQSQPMRASRRRGTGRGNTGASWRCTAQVQRLRKIIGVSFRSHYQQVSLRSDEVHTKLRRSTTSCNKLTQLCLPDNVICVIYASVFGRFMHSFIQNTLLHFVSEVISWISSTCF